MNTVQPGFVDSYEVDEETRAQIPMGRPAQTGETADAVAHLLSSESSYITSQNIRVDGGLTESVYPVEALFMSHLSVISLLYSLSESVTAYLKGIE